MTSYTESFTAADGALAGTDTDLTWSDVDAGWSVSGNAASCSGVSYSRAEHDTAGDDQYAEATVTEIHNDTGEQFGVCVRFQDAANTSYMFMVEATGANSWQARLRKTVNGTRSDISTNVTVGAPPYTIRVEAEGSTIRGLIGGVEEVSVTDTSITAGTRAGIYGSKSGGGDAVAIDDFGFGDLASGTTLVVAEALQTQTVDNLTLTQVHALAVADATQTQTADALALTQVHELVVQDALQTQIADNLTLTAGGVDLVVAEATQAQTSDNVVLTQDHQLVVADAVHAQAADGLVLTQVHNLIVQDASQTQTADNLDIEYASGTLVVSDAFQAQLADELTLTQVHELIVQDAMHSLTSDEIDWSPIELLSVSESAPTFDHWKSSMFPLRGMA